MGCPFLLRGVFPTQGLNPRCLHCRLIVHRCAPWEAAVFANQPFTEKMCQRSLEKNMVCSSTRVLDLEILRVSISALTVFLHPGFQPASLALSEAI